MHHTDCGMEFFTDEVMRDLLASSLDTAQLGPDGFPDVGEGPGSDAANEIDFLTIEDNPRSVVEDVERIRRHPLVPSRSRSTATSTTYGPAGSSRSPTPPAPAPPPDLIRQRACGTESVPTRRTGAPPRPDGTECDHPADSP